MNSKERVVEAVNLLIQAPNYSKLINEVTSILEGWATHPMTYANHLSPLNALIDVGVSDRSAFERLVKLIEEKRKLVPETKRVDYQREYMAERRARIAKAVELREMTHGAFSATERRKAYEKDVTARWAKAREEFIAAKGGLTWAQRHEAAGEFWAGIDATLNDNLATERARKRGAGALSS